MSPDLLGSRVIALDAANPAAPVRKIVPLPGLGPVNLTDDLVAGTVRKLMPVR